MLVLAIDPGTEKSAVIGYASGGPVVTSYGIPRNGEVIELLRSSRIRVPYDHLAIEMVAAYGMTVGREVFETCVWIGRFIEAAAQPYTLIYRHDVKMNLCGTDRAKEKNVNQALRDRLGPVGTKRRPGPTYGMKTHLWSALAIAVTYCDLFTSGDLDTSGIPY